MPSLKELLDEIEIKTDDLEKDDPLDPTKVKLEDLPEEQRPIFEKALGLLNEQTNELAKKDLVIQTLQSTQKDPDPVVDDEKDELGLEKDDQYAPIFNKLFNAIEGISKKTEVDAEKEFKTNLKSFAKDNSDIVRYANDMDRIANEHPTLMNDIPKLYSLAKQVVERRKEKPKPTTESTGTSPNNVVQIQQGKTIAEAFSLAEQKLGGK